MKKITLQLAIIICTSTLFAQWVPIDNGLDNFPPTSLWPFAEDMVLATYGGGIYKTIDNGDNWVEINGNLGNLNVKDIRGFASLTSMFIATEGGPYLTLDMVDYTDCTSTGLTNTDVNYFWYGNETIGGDFMVGTNGSGVFGSDEYTGPWSEANTGLSGGGMIINDMGGYSEGNDEYTIMATDGGTYWAINDATEWTVVNSGLIGDALKVKRLAGLGYMVLIATHDGLYYNYELADEWLPLIPDEKLNTVLIVMSSSLPTGFACLAFGENGFYSEDFFTWTQLDLSGINGEITAAHTNSTHIFLGVTVDGKNGKESGGIYRKPMDQLLVSIKNHKKITKVASLEQNYPNPFNNSTKIKYSITKPGFVSMKIYDVFGREVKSLINELRQSGTHSLTFEAVNLEPNTYFYRLEVENTIVETKRMILVR